MKVGFIGAGRMATTIGRHLIGAGHEVVLSSSRGPEALAGLVADLGPAASAGSKQEAAECDVVILATNWADAPEALKGIDWQRPHTRRRDERPHGRETGHQRCWGSEIGCRVGGPHVERDSRRNGAGRQAGEVDQQYADGLDPGFLATEAEDGTVRVRRRSRCQGARGRTYRFDWLGRARPRLSRGRRCDATARRPSIRCGIALRPPDRSLSET